MYQNFLRMYKTFLMMYHEFEAYRNESYECLCNVREKHKFYHDKLILRREFKQG